VTTDLTPREQAELLTADCDHVETRAELEARIAAKPQLTVKFGIDPTGSFLHLGHAVVLRKMQQFVELGHRVVLLIGDFTALIGDPTGRNESRPRLSADEIGENMREYREQAGRAIDLARTEIAYNSTWLGKLSMTDLIGLTSRMTVARMLERNDFSARYRDGVPIALHEFLYPIAQAYDSVALESDVELGGSDQLFNLLLGRDYQRSHGQPPQVCLTTPILEGTDGTVRMGKSRGNYVGLSEPASEQFGKLMRIPDAIVPRYARLAAFYDADAQERLARELAAGTLTPMIAKKDVAEAIVARYHGRQAALAARERFEAVVQRKETPSEIADLALGHLARVTDVLAAAGFAASKRDAERLIAGGAVKLDGVPVADPRTPWSAREPVILSVGSRRFARILPASEGTAR